MASFGRQALTQSGQPVQVAADSHPEWKTGGITLDWTTIAPVTADTTLTDGSIIKSGQKGLRYGAVLAEILASGLYGPAIAAVTGVTLTAATAVGTTSLPVSSGAGIVPGESLLVDTGATQETVQVSAVNGNTVTTVAPTTQAHALGVAVASPTDGRQTLARGTTVILNETVLQSGYDQLVASASDHPGVLTGGRVWHARILAGAAGQPTFAQLEAALPRLDYADL